MALKLGDQLPELSLLDQNGNEVNIKSFHASKPLVIFFYPKDFTPGCTKEACSFRDFNENKSNINVQFLGISRDNQKTHKKFHGELHHDFAYTHQSIKNSKKNVHSIGKLPGIGPVSISYQMLLAKIEII